MENITNKKTWKEIALLCEEMDREGSDLNKKYKLWRELVYAKEALVNL